MQSMRFQSECFEARTFLRKALFIAGTLKKVSKLTGISLPTICRIAGGKHKGTRATRMRLEEFILQYSQHKNCDAKT